HTLRFWEKELGNIIVPLRTTGGQRRYTREHVETIRQIKRLRDNGFSLAEIRSRMSDQNTNNNNRKLDIVDRVANEIAEIVRLALSSLLEKSE
ncbi:MAG TPA: MerR family transcriptional regulator, partial [Deltaproteobacteria bacterium]|nr:MerR family transcriptional regulator [Deltaproteobacteria bacterium]